MKNVAIVSSALLMTLGLASCNTTNQMVDGTHKLGAATVGTSMGLVAHTSHAIGKGVGDTLNTGASWVKGKPVMYHNNQMMMHNGHHYMLKNGKYVLVR